MDARTLPIFRLPISVPLRVLRQKENIVDKETINRTLPCRLSDLEFKDRSSQLAAEMRNLKALMAEDKKIKEGLKEKVKDLTAEIDLLAEQVDTKHERRSVPCDWEFDYPNRLAQLVRQDTGETVSTRKLHPEECQQPLGLVNSFEREDRGTNAEAIGDEIVSKESDGQG